MNFWREVVKFLFPNREVFTKDEKRAIAISKGAVRRIDMHEELNSKEKKDKAFNMIKERLAVLGIEIATYFINYAIEKAVKDLRKKI